MAELQKRLEYFSRLFSTIEIKPIISDSVDVKIIIDEGKDVYINSTLIEGIDASDSNLVLRELLFILGDNYDPEMIQKSKRRLERLEFILWSTCSQLKYLILIR